MKSPILQLTQVLEEVRDKSQEYKSVFCENEAATRAALIDPVLRALGWDTADPRRVIVEKIKSTNGDNERADYALQADGEFKFVIEAKKLKGNLKEHFIKLASYSIALKVPDIFITDGVRWHHYQNIGHDNQTPIYELNLDIDSLPHAAAYLIQHLDAALFVTDTPVEDRLEELAERLAFFQNRLDEFAQLPTTTSTDTPSASLTLPVEQSLFKAADEWEEIKVGTEYTKTKPTKIRLPDGRVVKMSKWKEALVECCRFAFSVRPTLIQDVPLIDKAGGKTHLIQTFRPASSSSYEPLVVGNQTLFVHTTYSANAAAANCLYIIDHVSTKETPKLLAIIKSK